MEMTNRAEFRKNVVLLIIIPKNDKVWVLMNDTRTEHISRITKEEWENTKKNRF